MPPPHADAIADCVLAAFHALPPKFKPRSLADGRREWVPLAGIVLSQCTAFRPSHPSQDPPNDFSSLLTCVALATGMKCLPHEKVKAAKGNVLHDSHAEILAIRGFNRWLVDECAELARGGCGSTSRWLRWRRAGETVSDDEGGWMAKEDGCGQAGEDHQPFALKENVAIHLFCSEAPCGDASMELVMREQQDDTPWPLPTPPPSSASSDSTTTEEGRRETPCLPGRAFFGERGIVRRKPSRPDAPLTLSKSCSDKLAMKQCTGLLSGLTARLVRPDNVYLHTFVLPEDRYVPEACERAFGREGRMGVLHDVQQSGMEGGYGFRPFEVKTTARQFSFSKHAVGERAVSSNLATVMIAGTEGRKEKQELLINGVLQGRRQDDPLGACGLSRKIMWESVVDVAEKLHDEAMLISLRAKTYVDVKRCSARERMKGHVREIALKGWRRNNGDDEWGLQ